MNGVKIIVIGFIAGVIGGFLVTNVNFAKSENDLIKEFYEVETAVHISPHGLRKHMGENDNVVIVDLRSQEEYEANHIITAINIPAYATPDKSDYGATERIISAFKAIPEDKEIIVYCYSSPCMTGRKIGKILADNDIYVKHLGIGWNEWRYDWDMWNHDGETKVDSNDYIISGSEPGVFTPGLGSSGCSIDNEFGC